MYTIAEWFWRFIHLLFVCMTGPTLHDEALWDREVVAYWHGSFSRISAEITPENWQENTRQCRIDIQA